MKARVTAAGTFALACTLLVAGCGHIPVSTMYKLWSFDTATADPAGIRAAIRIPAALRPRDGGAKLTITTRGPGDTKPEVTSFVLKEVSNPAELRHLDRFQRAGYPITLYKLSEADAASLRQMQQQIRKARETSEKREGSLGVSIDACHAGGLPPGAILSSTYLRLDTETGFMPLLDDVDLRKEVGESQLSEHIPPCAR